MCWFNHGRSSMFSNVSCASWRLGLHCTKYFILIFKVSLYSVILIVIQYKCFQQKLSVQYIKLLRKFVPISLIFTARYCYVFMIPWSCELKVNTKQMEEEKRLKPDVIPMTKYTTSGVLLKWAMHVPEALCQR